MLSHELNHGSLEGLHRPVDEYISRDLRPRSLREKGKSKHPVLRNYLLLDLMKDENFGALHDRKRAAFFEDP